MSHFVEFTPVSSPVLTNNNSSSSPKSYNDLINYCSIRKQFSRIIPQYMSIQNKKLISNKKLSSNIEEFRKYKQEIISLKESISILKEKKQKKLEKIEELRSIMRKVGNKSNNYPSKCSEKNLHINNYHNERESKEQRNNDQRFRGNTANDNKQCFANTTKGSCDDTEGGLSLVPSTSGISSGKDDDTAPESGIYQDADNQEDFMLSISNNSSSNSCWSNNCNWRCCFGVEKDKGGELKRFGLEKDSSLLEKES